VQNDEVGLKLRLENVRAMSSSLSVAQGYAPPAPAAALVFETNVHRAEGVELSPDALHDRDR